MSEQYEQSYYEIALTGRQVLVAFVILLVCLVAAFFSGLWVGRGGLEEGEAAALVAEEPIEEIAPDVQQLSFFEDDPARPARDLPEVAADPRPDTTLAEDVGAGRRAVESAPAEAGGDSRPPPEAAPAPRPAAPAGADRAPAISPASGDLVIQVFTSSEEAKAREVLARIERAGFRAFISPVAEGARTLYRVRVGPFERRAQAEATATRLRESLNLETWITQ